MSEQVTYCYIARKEGEPGCYAACGDTPQMKETAKFIAAEVRRGSIIERVITERAREMLSEYLDWKQKKKAHKDDLLKCASQPVSSPAKEMHK